ncbi:hypothetical protein FSP39_014434 [Pinctada imbricata]|uniref:RNA-directed DNA polymerase n=1 Tax=Pinctada imbricata TaxID=66713 RepID=A0AA89BP85_PINIB|nr:hypothetical protein FSP39_014434 [Pinctada imbricata]
MEEHHKASTLDSGIANLSKIKPLEEESPPKMSWDYGHLDLPVGKQVVSAPRMHTSTEMRSRRRGALHKDLSAVHAQLRTQMDIGGHRKRNVQESMHTTESRTPGMEGSYLGTPSYDDDRSTPGAKSVSGILKRTPEVKVKIHANDVVSAMHDTPHTPTTTATPNKQSIEDLQDTLATTLDEFLRLQEDVNRMRDQNSDMKLASSRKIAGGADALADPDNIISRNKDADKLKKVAKAVNDHKAQPVKRTADDFRRPKITPSTFDGTTPWLDFKNHFEYCVQLNEWNDKQKALFLGVSLRGAAQQILSNLSNDKKADYKELVIALEKRFAPPNIEELYKAELRMRLRKQGESLLELGQAVRRLVTLAYPNAPEKVLDTLSKDNFLNFLTDAEVRLKILRARPTYFDETLQIAVELDACMRAEEKRASKSHYKIVREVESDATNDRADDRTAEIDKLKSELQQLKELMQKQILRGRRGNRGRGRGKPLDRNDVICYNCNQKGHMSRQCPQSKEAEENPSETSKVARNVRSGCFTAIDSGLYIPTRINEVYVNFIVDSGASVTIVSYATYDAIPAKCCPPSQSTQHILSLADGKPLETKGSAVFEFRYGDQTIQHEAVVAAIRGPGILGLDFLLEHKCTLDLSSMTLAFEDENIQMHLEQDMQCCRVSVEETSVIPAHSERIITGQMVPLKADRPLPFYGIVEPSQRFMEKTGVMVGRSLVTASAGESVPIRLMNLSDDPKVIYKGTVPGLFEPIRTVMPQNSSPSTGRQTLPDHIQTLLDNAEDLTPKQRQDAHAFLLTHAKLFAEKGVEQGHTKLIKHTIDTGSEKPIRQQPRRVPYQLKKEIDTQIDNMLANKIIRPSSSPWASPIVLARKKDGSLRFCIDFRKLNAVTIKDAYPLPRIDDSLDALGCSRWFSTLDMMCGYWQVEVAETDKQKTAFTSHRGLFEFNVMPFGLCNAAGTFKRLMQTVCAGLRWDICLIYLDDIIVFSSTFEEHLERLDVIFKRLYDAGLRLRSKKCILFKHRVSYLGHIITENGVETDPEKINCIKDWPTPTNVADLRSFLGLCSYYRRFVKGFAKIASPLHSLTQKDKQYNWTTDCENAFQDLKKALVNAPILVMPDFSKTFILDTDASDRGIGAVLSQVTESAEKVISYGSRSLTKSEKKYSITRKELLAVVHFIKVYRPYLYGKHFILRTDHSALKWMMTFREPEGQLARWLDSLSEYDFEILHRAGKIHRNADALSRIDHEAPLNRLDDTVAVINLSKGKEDIRQRQADDPEIAEVMKWIASGKRPNWDKISTRNMTLKALWAQFDQLSIDDEVLSRKWYTKHGKIDRVQVVVPQSFRVTVLQQCHDAPSGGHLGRQRTLMKVKQKFYWPGMDRDVRKWCASCELCAKRKRHGKTPRAPMQITGAGEPGERVAMDILGPLPVTHKGNKYILVIQDYFTKWAEAVPLPDMEAKTIAQAFIDNFVTKFGVPRVLHTDQGRQFESRLFKQLCEILGINKTRTSPYHPQSDGMVERMNRTIENMLATYVDANQRNWDEHLQLVCMAYRAAEHESSGYTPNFLTFGREVVLPIELIAGLPPQKISTEEYAEHLEESLSLAHEIARKSIGDSLKRQKLRYDTKLAWKPFEIGSKIWLYTPKRKKGLSPKFQKWWTGPYTVLRKFSDVTYQIEKGKDRSVVHIDRLKPFVSRDENLSAKDTAVNKSKNHEEDDDYCTPYSTDVILDPVSAPYTYEVDSTANYGMPVDQREEFRHQREDAATPVHNQRRRRQPKRFEDFQLYHVTQKNGIQSGNQYHSNFDNQMARTKSTVRKQAAMHKCPLCIEIFQSAEEVIDHISQRHDKRIKCDHCEYTSERAADMKRHCERRHALQSQPYERERTQTHADDFTSRRRTQPMPVYNPKRSKPVSAADASLEGRRSECNVLMHSISPPTGDNARSRAPTSVSKEVQIGGSSTRKDVASQADLRGSGDVIRSDIAIQCDMDILKCKDTRTVHTQCHGIAIRKRQVTESEWTEYE